LILSAFEVYKVCLCTFWGRCPSSSRVVWVTGKVARITNRGLGLGIYVPAKLQSKLEPLRGCRVLVLVVAGDCEESPGSGSA
jgi:hypothetical protein